MTPIADTRVVFLAAMPIAALVTCFLLYRYLAAHWHEDAERSAPVLARAQSAFRLVRWVGAMAFITLNVGDLESLFGILPTVTFDFNGTHLLALCLGTLVLGPTLLGFKDPVVLAAYILAVLLAVLLVQVQVIEWCGWLWYLTFFLWVIPSRLLRVTLHPDTPAVAPSSAWIDRSFLRGMRATSAEAAHAIHRGRAGISREAPIYFGFDQVPVESASGHFLFAGASGSGKTILHRLMMQSVFRRFEPGGKQRALVFDAKHENVSVLQGMGLGVPITILNPFDERCSVWDFARDFVSPAGALKLARLLLPEDKNDHESFWKDSARGILSDIVTAHIRALRDGLITDWVLPDIVRALQSLETIQGALALHDSTRDALRNIREERTLHGILATLDLVRRETEVLGALWEEPSRDPGRRFSLTEWMEGSGIIVLGPSAVAEEVVNPLNRLVIDRVGQLILDAEEVPPNGEGARPSRTWLFLDEFPRLGRMPRIENLMTNGRSKGLVAVLGIQEKSDVQKLYSPEYATTILGACANKCLLLAPSPEHAEWASKVMGSEHALELKRSETHSEALAGERRRQITWAASEAVRPLFASDEFLALGKPGLRTPLWRMPAWVSILGRWLPNFLPRRFYRTSWFAPIRAICLVDGMAYRGEHSFTRAIEALAPRAGHDFIARPVAAQFFGSLGEPRVAPPVPADNGTRQLPPRSTTTIGEALWHINRKTVKSNET